MQSFLAESAPHRGRALALASAGLVALITLAAAIGHRPTHRPHRAAHHRIHTTGHCSSGVYLR